MRAIACLRILSRILPYVELSTFLLPRQDGSQKMRRSSSFCKVQSFKIRNVNSIHCVIFREVAALRFLSATWCNWIGGGVLCRFGEVELTFCSRRNIWWSWNGVEEYTLRGKREIWWHCLAGELCWRCNDARFSMRAQLAEIFGKALLCFFWKVLKKSIYESTKNWRNEWDAIQLGCHHSIDASCEQYCSEYEVFGDCSSTCVENHIYLVEGRISLQMVWRLHLRGRALHGSAQLRCLVFESLVTFFGELWCYSRRQVCFATWICLKVPLSASRWLHRLPENFWLICPALAVSLRFVGRLVGMVWLALGLGTWYEMNGLRLHLLVGIRWCLLRFGCLCVELRLRSLCAWCYASGITESSWGSERGVWD